MLNDEYHDSYKLDQYCNTCSTLEVDNFRTCHEWYPIHISLPYIEHLEELSQKYK